MSYDNGYDHHHLHWTQTGTSTRQLRLAIVRTNKPHLGAMRTSVEHANARTLKSGEIMFRVGTREKPFGMGTLPAEGAEAQMEEYFQAYLAQQALEGVTLGWGHNSPDSVCPRCPPVAVERFQRRAGRGNNGP